MSESLPRPAHPGPPAVPILPGLEHRFFELPGLRLHVVEAGDGEPVLLLHGFPQHWWEWRQVIPDLSEHYRVICPDLRGAGWTEAPPSGYTRDQLLADVVALLDALDLDRVRLVAHDWSALVGYQLCLRHPDRVQQYLCLGAHPYVRFDAGILPGLWRLWFQPVVATPVLGPWALRRGRLVRHLLRGFAPRVGTWADEDLEVFAAPFRDPAHARAGSALYRCFILPEIGQLLGGAYRRARLATPTLVLYGADDPGLSPTMLGAGADHSEHAESLAVEAVDGAAHFIADDRPDAVVQQALEFFSRPS